MISPVSLSHSQVNFVKLYIKYNKHSPVCHSPDSCPEKWIASCFALVVFEIVESEHKISGDFRTVRKEDAYHCGAIVKDTYCQVAIAQSVNSNVVRRVKYARCDRHRGKLVLI